MQIATSCATSRREKERSRDERGRFGRGEKENALRGTAYKHSRCSRSKGRFSLSRLIVSVALNFPTTLARLFARLRPLFSFPYENGVLFLFQPTGINAIELSPISTLQNFLSDVHLNIATAKAVSSITYYIFSLTKLSLYKFLINLQRYQRKIQVF